MQLSHFSDEPLTEVRDLGQRPSDSYFAKPRGLWVSVDGEDDWLEWCTAERFRLGSLAIRHRVTLAEGANILHLKEPWELLRFQETWGEIQSDFFRPGAYTIDWPRVAAAYQGIIIAPYQWSCRLEMMWYYGWDCASGCIWDPAAVAKVEIIEEVQNAG